MIKPVFLKTAFIFACFILASCSESNISSDVSGTVSEVAMTLNNTNNIVFQKFGSYCRADEKKAGPPYSQTLGLYEKIQVLNHLLDSIEQQPDVTDELLNYFVNRANEVNPYVKSHLYPDQLKRLSGGVMISSSTITCFQTAIRDKSQDKKTVTANFRAVIAGVFYVFENELLGSVSRSDFRFDTLAYFALFPAKVKSGKDLTGKLGLMALSTTDANDYFNRKIFAVFLCKLNETNSAPAGPLQPVQVSCKRGVGYFSTPFQADKKTPVTGVVRQESMCCNPYCYFAFSCNY